MKLGLGVQMGFLAMGEVVDDAHLVTFGQIAVHHVRADEPGPSCD